jgi:hypothetical protein
MERNHLSQLWHSIKGHIVQSVPLDDALCEFDCRKRQCTHGEWDSCERRRGFAAGELMPGNQQPAGETS